jgi:hypothetical protein
MNIFFTMYLLYTNVEYGFRDQGIQGLKDSGTLGFRDSRAQANQGFRDLGVQGIRN